MSQHLTGTRNGRDARNELLPSLSGRRRGLPRTARLLIRNPLAVIGVIVIGLLVAVALLPPEWLPHDPYGSNIAIRLTPPFWDPRSMPQYLLGTDPLGRDLLSVIMHGARFSLTITFLAVSLSLTTGVISGLTAGYYKGLLGDVLMRLADIQLAFPVIVLIVAVVAVLGPTFINLVVVLGLAGWAPYARIVRSAALSLREREFVEAARCLGARDFHIMTRHILPNTVTPIVIFSTFELARLLLLESSLSFLGLGVQPPTPSWGSMIADGRQYIFESWWASALPGLAIVSAVLGFNLLGDGLRDVLDPLSREQ